MGARRSFIVVTNCSATKRAAAEEPIRLRQWEGSAAHRFRWWRHAVERSSNPIKAMDRYEGRSWKTIASATAVLPGETQLWVVSAGLGLLRAEHEIPDYSATFAPNEPDSVGASLAERKEWWARLVAWRRENDGVGSLADLASSNPQLVFLVVLSTAYYSVLRDELIDTKNFLSASDNLLIISAGKGNDPDLGGNLLPITGKFEHLVGGVRSSLNAEMLSFIIKNYISKGMEIGEIHKEISKIADDLPWAKTFSRRSLLDADVEKFIRKNLKRDGELSASKLLRSLRDQGMACEEKRFRHIYWMCR